MTLFSCYCKKNYFLEFYQVQIFIACFIAWTHDEPKPIVERLIRNKSYWRCVIWIRLWQNQIISPSTKYFMAHWKSFNDAIGWLWTIEQKTLKNVWNPIIKVVYMILHQKMRIIWLFFKVLPFHIITKYRAHQKQIELPAFNLAVILHEKLNVLSELMKRIRERDDSIIGNFEWIWKKIPHFKSA